jgi:hypothetical protein
MIAPGDGNNQVELRARLERNRFKANRLRFQVFTEA